MFIVLASTLIALSFFYYMEQKRKKRNEQRHEDNKAKFEQLLDILRRQPKSDGNDEVSDTTEV